MAVVLAWLLLSGTAHAAEEDEDELPNYRPGLVAEFLQPGQAAVRRVDDDVQFHWGNSAPDARCLPGPFEAVWRGRLLVMSPGEYRLQLFVAGEAELLVQGEAVLTASAKSAAWYESPSRKFGYGYHPIELRYRRGAEPATLKLFWSGPQFGVEPVPERHLFHEPAQAPPTRFEEGRLLAAALRCAACHESADDESAATPAPALTHLRGNLNSAWLFEHLAGRGAPPDGEANPLARRMPYLALSSDDAAAVAAYLRLQSAESPVVKLPQPHDPPADDAAAIDPKKKAKPRTVPSVQAGRRLAHSLGCLACHRVGPLGSDGLFAGGDLGSIAQKRTPAFFVRWLNEARQVNADHRMPQFKLSPLEQGDLASYLATLVGDANATSPRPAAEADTPELAARGKLLVAQHRCGACHRLPAGAVQPERAKPLAASSDWQRGCLGDFDASRNRPGYRLPADARTALVEYFSHARPGSANSSAEAGRFVLQERNCLGCHNRGLNAGLAERVPAIAAALPELAIAQASLLPPSLNGVGDKLTNAALLAAVKTDRPPLRSWLKVRMPKFNLSDSEAAALTEYLVAHDRIPDRPAPAVAAADETAQRLAARRLVTADGFGCTSCHKIGGAEPSGTIAVSAMGTDLTMVGDRLRKPWFDRWVRNPARIVPRMEMPAVQLPVRGVLHDDVNEQLAAVWQVLNEPGFTPPKPNPVRIVRSRNVPGLKEPPHVLTDVFTIDDKTYVSPIVIGLPNRHNVLFDLETNRLAAWWTGDTALERTKGKSWYWEPGGTMVFSTSGFSFADEELTSSLESPLEESSAILEQNAIKLDGIDRRPDGVTFSYRLHNGCRIRQHVESLPVDQNRPTTSGFRRTVEIEPSNMAASYAFYPFAIERNGFEVVEPWTQSLLKSLGTARANIREPKVGVFLIPVTASNLIDDDKPIRFVVDYLVDLPLDTFPNEPPPLPSPPPQKLDVVPGFEAVRLPLLGGEMPTGLAWSADGTLLFSSLKGRVFAARDSNGDGLADALAPLSDDLATPYGLAVAQQAGREVIDVITKTALVRMHDDDRDGFYERQEIAADGWGHTDDYHDWAVGLPKIRTAEGRDAGYYVALPCQQDDRDAARARLRGQALKLTPREPTKDDPRRFAVEPFCGGLRFPMGLAVDRDGRLFATDNQGNYNPFNELNHLQPERRYGFINKLERKPGFAPPTESPAVEIPHPWTRSVNGICFLDTPPLLRKHAGRDHFGPFEGHLLGCEFNERCLVRISLETIDGTVQGAAYPFSVRTSDPAVPTFEGPNVAAIAPDGDLYVGSLLDSGWGGGQNTGSIARLTPTGELPPGLAEVRALPDGFLLRFTAVIDAARAARRENFTIERYRRESTPQYGGDDRDRAAVRVMAAEPSGDGREVRLRCEPHRAGFVYEFHLDGLVADGTTFFPAEAHYTMKRVPR